MTEYDGNQMALTQFSGGGWPGTAVGDAPMVEQGICSTEGNATVVKGYIGAHANPFVLCVKAFKLKGGSHAI